MRRRSIIGATIAIAIVSALAVGACSRETGEQPSPIGPAKDDFVSGKDAGDAALSTPPPAPPTAAPTSSANDLAAAEALFGEAKALMSDGKYVEACPKLEESDRLDPADGTKLNLAVCYEHLGDSTKACATFAAALKSLRAKTPVSEARETLVLDHMAKLKCPS